ncbi:tryptophan dimethylallyltransferase-domain-containing protein [Xylariaceae sp. FL0594]|nr:tryptophan dimethylallyltransferase-domain-containing protein [Xylariaceae sp. FL0594]
MFSLLGDFYSGQSPGASFLSILSAYAVPFLFLLLILAILDGISGGLGQSLVTAVRSLSKSPSKSRVDKLQSITFPVLPFEEGSQTQNQEAFGYPEDRVGLSVWHRVDAELHPFKSPRHGFWWNRHSGKALAILLHAAEYPEHLQHRDLKFFATSIAPFLGVSREAIQGSALPWPSFMTDDGTPLELSWDWGTTDGPPTIRYSIEPIGLYAGSSLDPGNLMAGPAFQDELLRSLADMRLEWFQHFKAFFDVRSDETGFVRDAADHNTSIFYAFDLSPTEVTAKAYFFPKARAQIKGQSNLEILSQAIRAAPYSTEDNLKAWDMFCDFSADLGGRALEYEMLAIDLIDPFESRLKIYFRCRETTFNSVIDIMTVGGRIKNPKLHHGLEDLKRLWNALFDIGDDTGPETSLRTVDHRTAGILYNIEFRLGELHPVAKIYLPVRHYASSDKAVMQGLNRYFQHHQRGKYMPKYVNAMHKLFSQKAMGTSTGVHTYIGCTIRPNGTLRVVSYFKPGIPEFRT